MKGVSKLGFLVLVLLLLFGWLLGRQVILFYHDYYDIVGLMEAQARKASVITDAVMTRTLVRRINSLEIPVDDPERALKIERFADKIIISMEYEEVLYLDLSYFGLGEDAQYDLWVFKFNPRAEQKL